MLHFIYINLRACGTTLAVLNQYLHQLLLLLGFVVALGTVETNVVSILNVLESDRTSGYMHTSHNISV